MFRIMEIPVNGPAPRYTDYDLFYVMKIIEGSMSGKSRMNREELGNIADLSIGTIRSIYRKLTDLGFAETYYTGITLTVAGREMLDALGIELLDLSHTDSAIGKYQISLLVRGVADKIHKGVEQRNDGLRAGGDGCTVIICREGRLLLPPDWDVDGRSPALAAEIRRAGINEGDAVIIGGSDVRRRYAVSSAVSAAFALL